MKLSGAAWARRLLAVLALLLLGYLALIALFPDIRLMLPTGLHWFGSPGSVMTITIVAGMVFILVAVILGRSGVVETGTPVAVVAGLAVISLAMGLTSYWNCSDEIHPRFFTALIWTAGLVKGSIDDHSLSTGLCPSPVPVALVVGRLTALAAVFLSLIGIAMALFRAGVDRLRIRLARTVTAVVDLDSEAESMLNAIADTLGRGSTLVVITDSSRPMSDHAARNHGARVVPVDFRHPETLTELQLWKKLSRLYLLSPDTSANLLRLQLITRRMSQVANRQRIPLIVRIDDPWQAAEWRAQHFGGAQTQWAADTVGKYEITAGRLLEWITTGSDIQRILVCGNSQLALALCADLAQRQLERDYYTTPNSPPLPGLTLVDEQAQEFKRDHEFSRNQLGLPSDQPAIDVIAQRPSLELLESLLRTDAAATAVILVDSEAAGIDASVGTRLAARFPDTQIYAWDPNTQVSDQAPFLVGRLRTYRLSLDVPAGQAHDAWERAARLIHDRYAAETGRQGPSSRPWAELDEFYRGSNRREVQNALWMAEKIGGHTWNTFGAPPAAMPNLIPPHLAPLEQLRLMGFGRQTALAMARAEHEDWCRYYRAAGWKFGPRRDDTRKIHDKLVDWHVVESDPQLLDIALTSLATTFSRLRQLGYRSRPVGGDSEWNFFRRRGSVVAERRMTPWTWTTRSGHTMQAEAGDWAVRATDNPSWWSVKDDIFRSRYEHVDGRIWRRHGSVMARRAREGETVRTLEGVVTAEPGDWVVQGENGERWAVPPDEFEQRYEGPISGNQPAPETAGPTTAGERQR